jgi:hypothetical protein
MYLSIVTVESGQSEYFKGPEYSLIERSKGQRVSTISIKLVTNFMTFQKCIKNKSDKLQIDRQRCSFCNSYVHTCLHAHAISLKAANARSYT